jgi:hypothetical protein
MGRRQITALQAFKQRRIGLVRLVEQRQLLPGGRGQQDGPAFLSLEDRQLSAFHGSCANSFF